ncbi:potassium uptake protein TrkH [Helicobacter fennelliae MRY12-0050]|uniref:Potassium uptake protein TrkH n=1 Tax=Helicobacter fennelliae MRY12-0050 TaxID=1325130 RepID=T1DVQ1_9HELI|nr:potassium uptake protein TrkH [Helicobacter fennelliae MRY12-0050]
MLGYLGIAILAGLLLMLPVMHKGDLSFIDAFFTASSAVSMTGLIVKNTPVDFTIWGQILIAFLIQIGGLGYMVIVSLVYIIFRIKLDFKSKLILKESLNHPTVDGVMRFVKRVIVFVLIFEGCGAVLLTLRFMIDYPFMEALWGGIFHAISAFNNAGFTIFDGGMMHYRGDLFINLVICSLIIIGGLGYLVLLECYMFQKKRFFYLSIHTKIVLITTATLIVLGTLMVFLFEYHNNKSIGELSLYEQILSSFFTSVNFRTSGFNTLDLSTFKDGTLLFGSIFMAIGGAPGGTAGGIKVTTIAVLLVYSYCILREKNNIVVFNKKIPQRTVDDAFLIMVVAASYIAICITLLSFFEEGGSRGFLGLVFEVCSAFGTVGVSIGDGGSLSLVNSFGSGGKILIILLMLSGRVGVLAFSFAIFAKQKRKNFEYPEGRVLL